MFGKLIRFLRWKLRGEIPTEKLVSMGLIVGKNFSRQELCNLDHSHCWLIKIGDNVTLAPRVQIFAHDASTKGFLNYTKIGLVEIGDNVFIGAGSIILPNTKIGNNVIVGAGSVVANDIPSDSLVAGNPAKFICSASEYLENNKELMKTRPLYDENWTLRRDISDSKKKQMTQELRSGIGFVD